MRLTYTANVRMPTERAHGIQIVKTCEALKKKGVDVELVVPDRHTPITESVDSYYGLRTLFPITKVRVLDWVSWGRIGFLAESVSFALAALFHVRDKGGVVFGRDEWVLAFLKVCGVKNVVWESHTGAWNAAARYLSRRGKMVVISEGLKKFYVEKGVAAENIAVSHDGVDLEALAITETKESARKRLGLPLDKKIALYIGGIGGWKGTDTLFEASALLPNDILVAVISPVSESIKKQYPRIHFLGERPYREIAANQQAGDVLILPTSARSEIGARFTSPLKLFTYMTSGVPIVASDLPSTREVLPERAAVWFEPDNAQSLVRAIEKALTEPNRAEQARKEVEKYTWDKRTALIASVIRTM